MPEDHNPVSRAMTKASIALAAVKQIRNWPVYFLDYAGLMKDNRVVYIFNSGTKISTRLGTSDRNIINEVWLTDVYQPKGFEIKKGDIVLDIGAHIGTFSLLASLVADAVYAYEPAPENFEVLQQNITMNRAKNIIAMRAAVAGVAGSRELFLRANDPCMHSMYFKSPLTTKITATSLEEIVTKNNIDHIITFSKTLENARV